MLHGDLHPANVLLSPDGPVVIDWTNAVQGPPGADVALSWLLMAGAHVEMSPIERVLVTALRQILVRTFVHTAGRDAAAASLAAVFAYRSHDANLSDDELEAMRRIVAHHGPG